MAESTLKQKTANGLFWGSISSGAQQLISVVFGIYLARILNADDYGLVGMLAIFMGIATMIINSGFSVALTNKQDANHEDYNAVFWFSFWVGLVMYILFYISAPYIAKFYGRPELTDLSRVFFLCFFLSGIGSVSYTVLFKKLMIKQQAIIDIIALLAALSVGILLALKGFAYWALVVQSVVQTVIATALRFIVAPWKPTLSFNFSPLKPMFSFGIKLFLTGLFYQINSNIFSTLLGRFYNATQVGYYAQGQKWQAIGFQFIGNTINSVTQPVLVQVNEDKKRQVNILRKLIRFGAFISFPMMLGLAFIGKEFILLTIGEKWLPSVLFLQLFCVWGAVGFLWTIYTNLICALGKSNLYLYGVVVTGLLQLIVIALMYPFGIFPMLIAYLLMNFVGLGVWQYYASKLIGLRLKYVLKDILPYLGITLGCFFVAWLLTKNIMNLYWLLTAKVTISGMLYFLVMKFSRSVIFKESMSYIRKK